MYDDRWKSFIIRAVGDINWNSGKTLYIRGPPFDIQGGGAGVFVAGKLFILTGLGGRAENFTFYYMFI